MGIGAGPLNVVRGTVSVTLTCAADQSYCAGAVTLKATGKGRTLTLGQSQINIAGGQTKAVAIPASNSKLRQLGQGASVPATISVSARDAAGRSGSSSRTARLVLTDRINPRVAILSAGLAPHALGAWVKLACPANQSTCAGTASLRTNHGGRNVLLGGTKLRINGGQTKIVGVTFAKRLRAQVAGAAWTRTVIRVEARNAAGKKGFSQRVVTLRSPGARR